MNAPASASPWQPLTFGGVAAFAEGTFGRLARVQLVVALTATLSVLWLLTVAGLPAIENALPRLPETGGIRGGRLEWPDTNATVLASGPFVALVVDPQSTRLAGGVADLEIVLRPQEWRLACLFGQVRLNYPTGWQITLARPEVDAWWRARQTAVLTMIGFGFFAGLLGAWWLLALLYAPAVSILAFSLDRRVTFGGAWRLAGAALLPGPLILSAALVLYGLHQLSFLGLLAALALHVPLGWLYAGLASWRLPKVASTAGQSAPNPFNPEDDGRSRKPGDSNPFAGPRTGS